MILLQKPGILTHEVFNALRTAFPHYSEFSSTEGHPVFQGSTFSLTVKLEFPQKGPQLRLAHFGWLMLINTESEKVRQGHVTIFRLSYGRGEGFGRFDFGSFTKFYETYWPELTGIITLENGEIPEFGFRDLTCVPEAERWDKNSPYMVKLFTRLIEGAAKFR